MPSAETNRIIGEIDTETNRIAQYVAKIQQDVHEGMSAAEVADVNGRLTNVKNALTGIGANPENPIPQPIA